jgi:hypothetical protein
VSGWRGFPLWTDGILRKLDLAKKPLSTFIVWDHKGSYDQYRSAKSPAT